MPNQFVPVAIALILVACASGCANPPTGERQQPGRITIDGNTHEMQSVSCTQVDWFLTIEATAGPTHAQVSLQLGDQEPTVETVSIGNANGFSGVAGKGLGNVEASASESTWTITGTAEASVPDDPGTPRPAPFRIEAPC